MKEKAGRLVSIFRRFKYAITTAAFLVWMVFFDRQNYFYRAKLDREMETLVKDTLFYHNEISENTRRLNELNGDRAALEKLGREKYLMKKDDEDVFVIVNEGVKK
jgi:cell division protein FtsB